MDKRIAADAVPLSPPGEAAVSVGFIPMPNETTVTLDSAERDIVRLALRGDGDMRRYVPEVMRLCAKLGIAEPPWFDDEAVRERVALNRPNLGGLLPDKPDTA
jgi:hypothetical protein